MLCLLKKEQIFYMENIDDKINQILRPVADVLNEFIFYKIIMQTSLGTKLREKHPDRIPIIFEPKKDIQ